MKICGNTEKYDLETDTCISCDENSYSTGLQAPECSSCQSMYPSLRTPSTPNFASVLFNSACSTFVSEWENLATACENGIEEDGTCKSKKETCDWGSTPDGNCKDCDPAVYECNEGGETAEDGGSSWVLILVIVLVVVVVVVLVIVCLRVRKAKGQENKKGREAKYEQSKAEDTQRDNPLVELVTLRDLKT